MRLPINYDDAQTIDFPEIIDPNINDTFKLSIFNKRDFMVIGNKSENNNFTLTFLTGKMYYEYMTMNIFRERILTINVSDSTNLTTIWEMKVKFEVAKDIPFNKTQPWKDLIPAKLNPPGDPVRFNFSDISRNGLLNIYFNQELKVPDFVKLTNSTQFTKNITSLYMDRFLAEFPSTMDI